jgi:hypothetical protein
MPDLMDELRAIAPSHEIPEWATKVAAGGREESAQPTVVRGVDDLRRSERAPGARRRTAWSLGLAAVVALIALVAATVWWAPWQPKVATPASTPTAMETAADQKPAAATARRQASGYIVQSPTMTSAVLCEAWRQDLTMDQGGCINVISALTGIDWSTIPWAKTGTDGTRAAAGTVQGTLQGESFAVDSVLEAILPTPSPAPELKLCSAAPLAGTTTKDAEQLVQSLVDGYQTVWWTGATSTSAGVLNIAVTADYVGSTRGAVKNSSYKGAYCVGTLPGPTFGDINRMDPATHISYTSGIGSRNGFSGPPQTGPLPRVNLLVTIRVPEQDAQIAAVYGSDWATYVFIDPIFTLVL